MKIEIDCMVEVLINFIVGERVWCRTERLARDRTTGLMILSRILEMVRCWDE